MAFNLDDYNTVPERLAEAAAKYPDGRFQTDIIELPAAFAGQFIAVKARYFRTPDDPTPGEGMAWELVPGKTPYTKDSELQNAETSAWGRALVAAFVADAKKGVASREEIQNRQPEPRPRNVPLEVAATVARLKTELLQRVGGDKNKAVSIWRDVLVSYGVPPDQAPSVEMLEGIEADLRGAA